MAKTYYQSPFGIAKFPWITKADTKFNADGIFKVTLVLAPGADTEEFLSFVKKASQTAFDEELEKLTPKDRKAYTLYCPVEPEEDDEGNPTGNYLAHFKQNAHIKMHDGTVIDVKIGVKDASGKKDVRKPVYGGSELRVMYSPRPVKMSSTHQAGVRLDFASVQIKTLQTSGGGGGFGAIEGYEEDQDAFDPGEGPAPLDY